MIIAWVVFSIVVGAVASSSFNRSGGGWFFAALFLSPLLAVVILIAVGKKPAEVITVDWRSIDWSGEHPLLKVNGSELEPKRACQAWRDRFVAKRRGE